MYTLAALRRLKENSELVWWNKILCNCCKYVLCSSWLWKKNRQQLCDFMINSYRVSNNRTVLVSGSLDQVLPHTYLCASLESSFSQSGWYWLVICVWFIKSCEKSIVKLLFCFNYLCILELSLFMNHFLPVACVKAWRVIWRIDR